LEKVYALRTDRKQTPAAWARHFSALLEAAGFPGERALDSGEFQTRAKWHEALGELAKLERISREEPIEVAFARLSQLCRDTLFQPESPSAPIHVLGVLESAGLRFDCLWVTGLTDEVWPMDARPNPFIPVALQKKAGIPQASAETSAALDRRLTEEWLAAAREVIVSFPAKEEDRDLAPSPLIANIPEGTPELPEYPRYRDLLFKHKHLVTQKDPNGPAVPPGPVRGGTRVLAEVASISGVAVEMVVDALGDLEELLVAADHDPVTVDAHPPHVGDDGLEHLRDSTPAGGGVDVKEPTSSEQLGGLARHTHALLIVLGLHYGREQVERKRSERDLA
jgi:hypothetical protein